MESELLRHDGTSAPQPELPFPHLDNIRRLITSLWYQVDSSGSLAWYLSQYAALHGVGVQRTETLDNRALHFASNGTITVGEMRPDGQFRGFVLQDNDLPSHRYEGRFWNGNKHGWGYEITDCDTYEGNFEQGKRHGIGYLEGFRQVSGQLPFHEAVACVVRFAEGRLLDRSTPAESQSVTATHTGSLPSSQRTRPLYDATGKLLYKGQTVAGLPDGYGKAFHRTGRTAYEGEWRQGYRHGLGTAFDEQGDPSHHGQWRDDRPLTGSAH